MLPGNGLFNKFKSVLMKVFHARYIILTIFILLLGSRFLIAQPLCLRGHSHNDYEQTNPFFSAYESKMGSIEADIWVVDSVLLVAHETRDVVRDKTLWSLYISPIIEIYTINNNQAWQDSTGSFQLLIDLKSPAVPALDMLVELLLPYSKVFDRSINPNAIAIVISGSRPKAEDFVKYPKFINFDGNIGEIYTPKQLERIPLFSASFRDYSNWNGKGRLPSADQKKIQNIVNEIHKTGKKVRFWAAPDNENAWDQFLKLGVDFINTDKPAQFATFCSKK